MVKIPTPELVDTSKLIVHPNNVKEHSDQQIKNLIKLIEWVGFKDPIVIDKQFNVKAGHGRLLAAQKLQMLEVPCVYLEGLTKKQMDLFIYMDNKINESNWIDDNVKLLLKDIPMEELEVFDENWNKIKNPTYKEESEEIPLPPAVPKSKPGQVYQLGKHRIMCGDNKLISTLIAKPGVVITDPPYGHLKIFNKEGRIGTNNVAKKRHFEPYHDEGTFEIDKILPYLLSAKYTIIWGGNYFAHKLPIRTSWLCWDKRAGKHAFFSDFELAWTNLPVGAKMYVHAWAGMIRAGKKEDLKHPTQKPVDLFRWIIEEWVKPDQIVVDPFLGSGSTLIACEQTKRTCYGMEINPAYIDVIIERWENLTGKKAVLVT